MKLKYLGTAAAEGIPALFCNCDICKKSRELGGKNLRSRSQAIIDNSLLIDFSPDTFYHVQRNNIDLLSITELIITHSHFDHFYPQDLIYRYPPYSYGVNKCLNIYGNNKVKSFFDKKMEKVGAIPEGILKYNYVPPFIPFIAKDYIVYPIIANHDKSEDCYIYLIENNNKKILYAHDTGQLCEESINFLDNKTCDLVSLDCTMGLDNDGNNHLGLKDVDIFVDKLRKHGIICDKTKIVVNHFSHNGKMLHHELEEYVKDKNYIVAYDGLEIEI